MSRIPSADVPSVAKHSRRGRRCLAIAQSLVAGAARSIGPASGARSTATRTTRVDGRRASDSEAARQWTTRGSTGPEAYVDGPEGHLVSHGVFGQEFAEMVPVNFPPGITLPAVVRFDIVSLAKTIVDSSYGAVDFFLEGTDFPAPLLHFYMSIDDPAEGHASAVDTGFSGFDFGTCRRPRSPFATSAPIS
jgi:hypothetical protein